MFQTHEMSGIGDRAGRSSDKRRIAIRIAERIAGELFKLPHRE